MPALCGGGNGHERNENKILVATRITETKARDASLKRNSEVILAFSCLNLSAGFNQQFLDFSCLFRSRPIFQGRLEFLFGFGPVPFMQPGGTEVIAKGRRVWMLVHEIRQDLDRAIAEVFL